MFLKLLKSKQKRLLNQVQQSDEERLENEAPPKPYESTEVNEK